MPVRPGRRPAPTVAQHRPGPSPGTHRRSAPTTLRPPRSRHGHAARTAPLLNFDLGRGRPPTAARSRSARHRRAGRLRRRAACSSSGSRRTARSIGIFSNGQKLTMAKIGAGQLQQPGGLEKIGDTAFRTTTNSGLPQIGAAGGGGSRHAARRRARDEQRRPGPGVHQPDHRPARLPGELPGDHDVRRDAAGPGRTSSGDRTRRAGPRARPTTAPRRRRPRDRAGSGAVPASASAHSRTSTGHDTCDAPDGPDRSRRRAPTRPRDAARQRRTPSKDGHHDHADPAGRARDRRQPRPHRAGRGDAGHGASRWSTAQVRRRGVGREVVGRPPARRPWPRVTPLPTERQSPPGRPADASATATTPPLRRRPGPVLRSRREELTWIRQPSSASSLAFVAIFGSMIMEGGSPAAIFSGPP